MELHQLNFSGHYEDEGQPRGEQLQLVTPEHDLEQRMLAWSLMPHNETVDDDPDRPDYVFLYQLGEYLERGLYRLTVTARAPDGSSWDVHMATGLAATAAPAQGGRVGGFVPFWFISKSLLFQCSDERVAESYPGDAFGHLLFNRMGNILPHRRLHRIRHAA